MSGPAPTKNKPSRSDNKLMRYRIYLEPLRVSLGLPQLALLVLGKYGMTGIIN